MGEYSNSSVVILNDIDIVSKNGELYINSPKLKNKLGLLKCYAPWCPHCTTMVNDLKYLAENLEKYFFIASIDCDKNKHVIKKLGLSGFPSMYYVDINGKIEKQYEGPRDNISIVNNIKTYVENKL